MALIKKKFSGEKKVFSLLQIYIEFYRTVIATHNVRKDPSVFDLICDSVAYKEIVDPPSRIMFTRSESV